VNNLDSKVQEKQMSFRWRYLLLEFIVIIKYCYYYY